MKSTKIKFLAPSSNFEYWKI